MGDHFVLLVDRLLTESTLEAAIESSYHLRQNTSVSSKGSNATEFSSFVSDPALRSSSQKLVGCRICHDDDEDTNMEIPCSCRGSLKYAHRKCVQRWCNEKGDTICEICHQQFQPAYAASPPLFHYNGTQTNFRGNWETPRRELHNPRLLSSMIVSDRGFLDSDFEESHSPSPKSLMCCRAIAVIFMVLLVLRHTLPIIISGAGEYSSTLFMLLIFRTIGILLPVYVTVKAFTVIQRRHHQQDPSLPYDSSDEESEVPQMQSHSRVIHIQ